MTTRMCVIVFVLALSAVMSPADTIVFSGAITQSVPDGTGPAVSNPSLNNIRDGDIYTVTFSFPGAIIPSIVPSPNLVFTDSTHPASESSFFILNLSVIADGTFDDFSLLACLTGGGCAFGNQMTANFKIPAALLHSQNVAAIGLDQPHPLDLLEDEDTDTPLDIHGSITSYSYISSAAAVPEPSSFALLGLGLLTLVAANRKIILRLL